MPQIKHCEGMHRNPIHRSLLALVLTGVLAASAQAQTLVVNPVTGKGYSGTASYVVANVAADSFLRRSLLEISDLTFAHSDPRNV